MAYGQANSSAISAWTSGFSGMGAGMSSMFSGGGMAAKKEGEGEGKGEGEGEGEGGGMGGMGMGKPSEETILKLKELGYSDESISALTPEQISELLKPTQPAESSNIGYQQMFGTQ